MARGPFGVIPLLSEEVCFMSFTSPLSFAVLRAVAQLPGREDTLHAADRTQSGSGAALSAQDRAPSKAPELSARSAGEP